MLVLGIEGGGTRTTATLVDAADQVLTSVTAGPGNLRLLADDQLTALLDSIRDQLPAKPDRIGVGMAGVRTAADRDRLVDLVPPAVLLTGCRADPAEHAWEWNGALEDWC